MSIDRLMSVCERVVGALRMLAKDLDQVGLTAYAKMARTMATEIEQTMQQVFDPPPDETPPSGLYLTRVLRGVSRSQPSVEWLAQQLIVARSLVRRLLAPAEITGDADLLTEAQGWLETVDEGPDETGDQG